MKLLLLSKENIPLARGEAEALLGKGTLDENILLINTNKTTDRLACTRLIANVLFETTEKALEKAITSFNWNKIIKKTFAVYFREDEAISQSLSREYGGIIYDELTKPEVNLSNPDSKILIFKTKNKIYVTLLEWENEENSTERSSKLWPSQRPITMKPKITRACVNLTGATKSIYDPMCGTGGFLIEAGLMGLKVTGSDNDDEMIKCSETNLKYYKIKNFKLFVKDGLKITKDYDYIITDMPYGKNTKDISDDLYPKFIKVLEKHVKKRAVLIFPDFANVEKLLKKSKLKIKAKYSHYLHKSLSREIFVMEK